MSKPRPKLRQIFKNKGTGAGGSNANKHGLSYEELTDLNDMITIIKKKKYHMLIKFKGTDTKFIKPNRSALFKYLKDDLNSDVPSAHGCKRPDECYINSVTSTIFIIEKKFQQCKGSVCEKIQTPDFKIWQYSRTFPSYNIVYIYCLSDWFKDNCKAELQYLAYKNIPVFWGNDKNYKEKIIKYLTTYNK